VSEVIIGVIGCGNMSSSIVEGIHNVYPNIQFKTFTPSQTKAILLAEKVNGTFVKTLDDLNDCDLIFIGCKPQQFNDLTQNLISSSLNLDKHFVSMMAATPFYTLKEKLPKASFTRVMPNTPITLGAGITLMLNEKHITPKQEALTLKLFSACSQVHMMDSEMMLDQVTTVSGCGPAYVFLFAKYFCDELICFGINEDDARAMVVELFKGSALLMESSKEHSLETLISNVTSKGGVTIEAINTYKKMGLSDITHKALKAAYKRSVDISSGL
jgi:pyrroline-5-carboxylate reductase